MGQRKKEGNPPYYFVLKKPTIQIRQSNRIVRQYDFVDCSVEVPQDADPITMKAAWESLLTKLRGYLWQQENEDAT